MSENTIQFKNFSLQLSNTFEDGDALGLFTINDTIAIKCDCVNVTWTLFDNANSPQTGRVVCYDNEEKMYFSAKLNKSSASNYFVLLEVFKKDGQILRFYEFINSFDLMCFSQCQDSLGDYDVSLFNPCFDESNDFDWVIPEIPENSLIEYENDYLALPSASLTQNELDENDGWDIEIDKIIEDLETPLLFDKSKSFDDIDDILVDDYYSESDLMSFSIPFPPQLPEAHRICIRQTTPFKKELQMVRSKVTGKIDTGCSSVHDNESKSVWLSIFR